jgi:hypothetical protein
MPEIWTPSDGLLASDPIASQKLATPFEPPDLTNTGIVLFDVEDDDANEAAACAVLASLEDDDAMGDESGDADDDDDIDDPDDQAGVDDAI